MASDIDGSVLRGHGRVCAVDAHADVGTGARSAGAVDGDSRRSAVSGNDLSANVQVNTLVVGSGTLTNASDINGSVSGRH